MWITDNHWEEREDSRVHYLPGLCPLEVDEGIVKEAKFMDIHIIWKAELKTLSTRMLQRALLIKVHHGGDVDTLWTDEPLGEFQAMLMEFQGLLGKPTYANSEIARQADFEIKIDPNGKIPFC